jgi:MarR family transcriptional regulator, organic hydroperoxide resistance regulator
MEVLMDGTALTDDVGFLLSRTSAQFIRAANAALAVHGLRVRSYSALLLACGKNDGMSQRGLAEALALDPSQVVAIVDELAEAGLVERRPSETDRRTKRVVPTAGGRAAARAAQENVEAAHDVVLEPLSLPERDLLRALLGRLAARPAVVAER